LAGGCSGSSQPKVQQGHFLYTNDDIPTGFGTNAVSAFSINPDGSLSSLAASPFSTQGIGNGGNGFSSARRIAITLDGKFLFAANDGGADISSFSVDPITGSLTLISGSPFPTGGDGSDGLSLAVSPDGRFLYVSNTSSSNISVLQINQGQLKLYGSPVPVTGGTFPVDLRVTEDDKYLAVTIDSLSGGLIGMYNIAGDGALSQVSGSPFSDGNPPGGFTDSLDINCAANRLFVLNNSGLPLVDVLSIGPDGTLSHIPNSPYTTPGGGGGTLYLGSVETRLFVGNQSNSVSVFSVSTDGSLELVPSSPFAATGGAFLGGLVNDPASQFLYAAGFNNRVVGLQINADGTLSQLSSSPFTASPVAVAAVQSLAVYPPKTCPNP
jgi:6-phosphogluconolactonase (cycloisomerase 2 family)